MIQVAEVTARTRGRSKVDLGPVSLSLESGTCSALVGAREDGPELLLSILAGVVAPRRGTVTVDGSPASPRRSLAYVPAVPDLPTALDVDEYLVLSSSVRGEPHASPRERLALLGVTPLARRRIRDLTLEESRTVAFVEALTSKAKVLLLVEPLVDLDPRAVGHIATVLQARVDAGATAVISTASRGDARALCEELFLFVRGALKKRTDAEQEWSPPVGPNGARLFIRSEGARFLLAELGADPTFVTLEGEGATLVVTGKDPVAMASAVAVAARHASVELDQLSFEAPEEEST